MTLDKLYTWIDVQDVLEEYFERQNHKSWLVNISFQSYWDGLTIAYATTPNDPFPKTPEAIFNKLAEIFLARFQKTEDSGCIMLEGNNAFPINLEEVATEEINEIKVKPTLNRLSYIGRKDESPIQDRNPLDKPIIYAFHSFKGGVGRTLHAIAFALQLAEKNKVLLIDADFEAPGISWLIESSQISFADFLALIHGNLQNQDRIIKQVSDNLKVNTLENDNLFILPAFRGIKNGNPPILEVKPEHIYKFSNNPFILTDILEKLAKEMGVDYVIIDLRAGVSELSSGWFFDPRVNKVFVTTLSSQSILGTTMMFNVLAKFQRDHQVADSNSPFLIVSQVPKETVDSIEHNWLSADVDGLLGELRRQYGKAFIPISDYSNHPTFEGFTEDEILSREIEPLTLFSVENDNLKSLPDTWKDVSKVIKVNGLNKDTLKLINFIPPAESLTDAEADNYGRSRRDLKDKAHNLIFAEQTDDREFLVTTSIGKFADAFKSQVPIAVIVGAKGSGKTFLFKQIANAKTWESFTNMATKVSLPSSETFILPVIVPQNLSNNTFVALADEISQITNATIVRNIWGEYIKPDIESALKNDLTNSQWRQKWLDYIAWAAGYEVGIPDIGSKFIEILKSRKAKLVAIFDGLEDLFKQFDNNTHQQRALESLLQDVPNWLDSQPEKFLGIVVFVRRDIVTSAISQNAGQFLAKYDSYELKWDSDEALRLVHWILNNYGILSQPTFDDWRENLKEKDRNELIEPLYKLWGMRMAKDASKEAYSHTWILGSLANLKKEFQSRDIVRFLEIAAEKSITADRKISELYRDRVLYPSAIRDSIIEVGQDKIEEVKKENQPLKTVLELLEQRKNVIKFPCKPNDIEGTILDRQQIKILEDNGVIRQYQDEYYMAEIYRKGIGFANSRKGRPKVLYI